MTKLLKKWKDASRDLPPTNSYNDSENVLCLPDSLDPFVGWYNSKTGHWAVSHWKADSQPVKVSLWRVLPKVPDIPLD